MSFSKLVQAAWQDVNQNMGDISQSAANLDLTRMDLLTVDDLTRLCGAVSTDREKPTAEQAMRVTAWAYRVMLEYACMKLAMAGEATITIDGERVIFEKVELEP